MSKPKSNMQVPISWSGQDKRFGDSIKENLDVIVGHRGDPLDKAITARDLIESGIATLPSGITAYGGSSAELAPSTALPNLAMPPAPTNLSASGAFQNVLLTWSLQDYAGHAYVEVWRNATNNIASASRLDTSTIGSGAVYSDNVGSGQSFYYWVRAVNQNGDVGPYNSSIGTLGQTATDTSVLLNALSGAITSSELGTDLATPIGNLPTNTSQSIATLQSQINTLSTVDAWASGTSYSTGDLVTNSGNLYTAVQNHTASSSNQPSGTATSNSYWTYVGAYTTLASAVAGNTSSISDINYISSSSGSAAAQKIAALDSTVNNATTGVSATATAVSGLQTSMTNAESGITANSADITALENTVNDSTTGVTATASAVSNLQTTVTSQGTTLSAAVSDISTLNTTVGDNSTSITTNASSINGLEGKYTVKIDTNGAVAGFGLASTANSSGNITSEFIVNADRFAIMRGGSDTTAATVPFVVQTTATTLNGESVSAGVYMDGAFIKNGEITNAKIGDAAIDDAKIANLSAGKITSGTIDTSLLNIDSSSLTSVNGVLQVGNLAANKITSGTLNASNVTISNLYADNITGDINQLIPFSLPSAVQIGGGDTQVWAGQFPSQSKPKKPYVSAVGFGNWENDVVYLIKLQMKANVSITSTSLGSILFAGFYSLFGSYYSYRVEVSGDKQNLITAGGELKIGGSLKGTVNSTTYDTTSNRTKIFYTPVGTAMNSTHVGSTLTTNPFSGYQTVSRSMFRPDYDDHPEPFVISGGLSTAYSVTVDVRIMFDTLYTNQGNLPISNHPTNWNNDQVFELDGLMMALR